MSKVYQCDRCKRIFEPRVLQNGETYIARKNKSDLDLCPECYDSLIAWFKHDDDECKCGSCKFNGTPITEIPCKECSQCWSDNYEPKEDKKEDCIGVTCKTCKWYNEEHSACIADYMTQHRCSYHSEWEAKE